MYQLAALDAKLTMSMSKLADMTMVLADTPTTTTASKYTDILKNASTEISDTNSAAGKLYTQVSGVGNNVYQIVLAVVTVILLIIVVIAGASMALAPAAERQEAKKKLVYVIAGALIVFAAIGIIGLVANFGGSIIPDNAWDTVTKKQ